MFWIHLFQIWTFRNFDRFSSVAKGVVGVVRWVASGTMHRLFQEELISRTPKEASLWDWSNDANYSLTSFNVRNLQFAKKKRFEKNQWGSLTQWLGYRYLAKCILWRRGDPSPDLVHWSQSYGKRVQIAPLGTCRIDPFFFGGGWDMQPSLWLFKASESSIWNFSGVIPTLFLNPLISWHFEEVLWYIKKLPRSQKCCWFSWLQVPSIRAMPGSIDVIVVGNSSENIHIIC